MNEADRRMMRVYFGEDAVRHERRVMKGMREATGMPFARPPKVFKKFMTMPNSARLMKEWTTEPSGLF
jgi:hypothetical protein